jgi:hypothetical protein
MDSIDRSRCAPISGTTLLCSPSLSSKGVASKKRSVGWSTPWWHPSSTLSPTKVFKCGSATANCLPATPQFSFTIFMTERFWNGTPPMPVSRPATHINWDACGAALLCPPLGRSRRWVSKHTSGFCGVGTKMVYWKQQPTPACPRCGDSENTRHIWLCIWLCQEPAVYFVWALLMASFSAWLESVNTANDITYWIIQHLTEWRSNEPFSLAHTDMPRLLLAIAAQDRIG